jgi:ketosteroid isomerase-like protein
MTPAQRLEGEVLAANERFYEAFSAGDLAAMKALWAEDVPVACLHPGQPLLLGRDAVMRAWAEILLQQPGFTLRGDDPRVQLLGDVAIVYCYEAGEDEAAHLAATNVFVRERASWRMVHHHAGPLSVSMAPPPPNTLN